MSEIYVEDDVDCSGFVKSEPEPTKVLISENSFEFTRISENKSKVLIEKAVVFQKVRTIPKQVFTTKGLNKNQTVELKSMVEDDNKDGN